MFEGHKREALWTQNQHVWRETLQTWWRVLHQQGWKFQVGAPLFLFAQQVHFSPIPWGGYAPPPHQHRQRTSSFLQSLPHPLFLSFCLISGLYVGKYLIGDACTFIFADVCARNATQANFARNLWTLAAWNLVQTEQTAPFWKTATSGVCTLLVSKTKGQKSSFGQENDAGTSEGSSLFSVLCEIPAVEPTLHPLYFSCQCQPGFKGDRCETRINMCHNNPCKNAGKCVNGKPGTIRWGNS